MNLPKFVSEDVKLFQGLFMDLFPNTELPDADYGDLLKSMFRTKGEGAPNGGTERAQVRICNNSTTQHTNQLTTYSQHNTACRIWIWSLSPTKWNLTGGRTNKEPFTIKMVSRAHKKLSQQYESNDFLTCWNTKWSTNTQLTTQKSTQHTTD